MRIIAFDCCDHILNLFRQFSKTQLISTSIKSDVIDLISKQREHIDLIVIGLAQYEIRRLFIALLRKDFPEILLLILKEEINPNKSEPRKIRGVFVISDRISDRDYKTLKSLSSIFPLPICKHIHKSHNLVQEVIKFITHHLKNEDLSLDQVAKKFDIPAIRLSKLLNKQTGLGFKQMLRQLRIEEAKALLDSHTLSIKEVAAQVGFTDSHYFSRTFKRITGISPSEYRVEDPLIY